MRQLWSALRTTPAAITWVGWGCLVVLLVKLWWLNDIPALFNRAPDLGLLVENLLAATVAAYIFFVISFQLPQVVERNRIGPGLARLLEGASNGVMGFLQMIRGATSGGLLVPEAVTLESVESLFQSVSPNLPAPMVRDPLSPRLNWLEAMAEHDTQCRGYIRQTTRYARFLDADLVALLDAIEFSRHVAAMKTVREYVLRAGAPIYNPDLTAWAENYYECYDAARKVHAYAVEYRRTYGIVS